HEPLITEEQYQKAQEILGRRYHVPYQLVHGITNPLAGLVRCDMCGQSMVLRPYTHGPPHIRCNNSKHCGNKSSRFEYVEKRVIASLKEWLEQYRLQWDLEQRPDSQPNHSVELREFTVSNLQTELKNLQQQKGRLHDLLERGIYDEETYLESSKHLADKISKTRAALEGAVEELDRERERAKAQINIIPKVEHVIEVYDKLKDPKQKNTLLKGVLEKVVYRKEKYQRNDQFTLVIYPKLD